MKNKILMSVIFSTAVLHGNGTTELLLTMGAQLGGSIANQAVTTEFDDMATALQTSQTSISKAMNTFATSVNKANKTSLNNTYTMFKQATTNINQLQNAQQVTLTQLSNYIKSSSITNAAMESQPPLSYFLQNATTADQLFADATMYTPTGPVWKNLYPVGTWEYDESSDSFWQMTATSDGATTDASSTQAMNNSIFTEWITRKSSYVLEAEITLYRVSYPFFAGLIFNKARWISGDPTCVQKYRLLGIYATSSSTAKLYFAEAISTPSATVGAAPTWTFPFEQIVSGSKVVNISVPATFLTSISEQPVVFRLKILVSAAKVQCKFWQLPNAEPATYTSMTSANPDLYLYHGVGLMAPGCLAQFALKSPQEILFTQAAQEQFSAQVKAFVSDTLLKQNVASIDALATGKTGGAS